MRNVQMPRLAKRLMPAFTKEDVENLLDTCIHLRDKAMILCLIDSGCRSLEFMALRVEDADMRNGVIRVKNGKGGKNRVTYVEAKARKVLLRYLLERGEVASIAPLWISFNTGKGLTHYGLRLILHRLGKRAGIQPLFHSHLSPYFSHFVVLTMGITLGHQRRHIRPEEPQPIAVFNNDAQVPYLAVLVADLLIA